MIDLEHLRIWVLTALFNPTFLFFLLMLFIMGKLLGMLTVRMNIWKFLLLAYFGIFLIEPFRNLGPILGAIFLLGFASNHFSRIPGILSWAQSIGDVFFAFQHRSAYEEIRRQELEIEELKRQLQAAQMAVQSAATGVGMSQQQQQWKQQAQQQRSKPTPDGGGGRGDGASQQSRRSDGRTQQKSTGKPQGKAQSGRPNGTGWKPKSKPNQKLLGGPPPSQGQKSQQQKSQSGSAGNANLSVRDQYLVVLELSPGQTYTPDEIKAAWRKMAKKTHPDTGGSKAAFIQVVNAYNFLK